MINTFIHNIIIIMIMITTNLFSDIIINSISDNINIINIVLSIQYDTIYLYLYLYI